MSDIEDELLVTAENGVGQLSLNRPRALHALTRGMCLAMIDALDAWRTDDAVRLIVIDHAGGRGFCAGGDIRAVWESAKGDGEYARGFFFDEYRLNYLLFTYAKPIVAFMDGIVMGGGAGIALPAKYRVATERTLFAMPETGIGLFPDVGGGWHLARLPGRIGTWLALTGARLNGAECRAVGLATHYLPSETIDAVKAQLAGNAGELAAILGAAAVSPPEAAVLGRKSEIDRLFAGGSFEAILGALAADGGEWAADQRRILAAKSPQACKVSLRLVRQGRNHTDFADEMRIEYGVAVRVVQRHDFIEGVRALLIDKDNAPRWEPATPEDVSDHLIDTIFSPLPEGETWHPLDN